jgi:hypothetical protein
MSFAVKAGAESPPPCHAQDDHAIIEQQRIPALKIPAQLLVIKADAGLIAKDAVAVQDELGLGCSSGPVHP